MSPNNNWYEGIEKEISSLKEKMNKRDYAVYELNALLRVAKRISSLSDECSQCAELKENITHAISGIAAYRNISKKQKKNYIHTFRVIAKHLKESHSIKIVRSPNVRKMQYHKIGPLEFTALIIGILGFTGLTAGYLVIAVGYSSGMMGFFAALTITGFILALGQKWYRRIIGSILMLTVGALGFGTTSFVPEISKYMLEDLVVAIIIIIPAMVYILSGILYLVVGINEIE